MCGNAIVVEGHVRVNTTASLLRGVLLQSVLAVHCVDLSLRLIRENGVGCGVGEVRGEL